MKDLTAGVKETARRAGVQLVGIAPVERFAQAPEGHKPNDLLKNAGSVISMVWAMPYGTAQTVPSGSYLTYGYDLLNEKLHEAAFAVAWFLEERGYITLPLQTAGEITSFTISREWPEPEVFRMGLFSHRHAAVEAGLGEIGMHSALVTPQYGSRVRLVSVISTAKLIPDRKLSQKVCDPEKCHLRCVKVCPSKAISGNRTISHYRCMTSRLREVGEPYDLNRFKEYGVAHALIRSRKVPIAIPTCGRCIAFCPVGALETRGTVSE